MDVLFYENSAGFSSYTHKLCNAVSEADGINVTYMTPEKNDYTRFVNDKVKVEDTLLCYSKAENGRLKWFWDRIAVSYKNIVKRNKLLKAKHFDIMSMQATIPVIDRFLLKKAKKYTKIVYTVHDVIPPIKSFYWNMSALKKVYRTADHLVVHTNTNKKQLMEIFGISPEKISVIHHGTDIEYKVLDKEECRKKTGINNNKKTLLFYGLIREQKGLDILIKALKGIDCNLIIAGAMPHGESFDKYETLLKENNINCIKYIEFVSEEFTDVLYQACDWVVLPYIYFYSQSGVFMQAIKYRKPIIATDVAGFREYVEKYNIGRICSHADAGELHELLKETVNNDKAAAEYEKNGENAARNCSWENSARIHISLFEKVKDQI